MNFYHTWLYKNVINTEWLLWIIVVFVLAFNILSPIIIWGLMNGQSIIKWAKKKGKKKNRKEENQIKS
ncbi:Uncharacterised protein [Mycobacteroides abscessus subsp. abscessus]|nr:Uncharacterised protein [Mycobacteroides abscessus subsp. abscessus]HEO8420634.1 hypothetical protein [Yersinia enterocolitica]